jgi:hypothetical protein
MCIPPNKLVLFSNSTPPDITSTCWQLIQPAAFTVNEALICKVFEAEIEPPEWTKVSSQMMLCTMVSPLECVTVIAEFATAMTTLSVGPGKRP